MKEEITIGILKGFRDFSIEHWQKACEDLGFAYEIIAFTAPDWIEQIERSRADVFVCQPEVWVSVEKQLFDERLYFLSRELKKTIYPSYNEIFIYENKRNMAYWLKINRVPHPETKVYYLRSKAQLTDTIRDLERLEYPQVFKTYIGSAASGVRIIRSYSEAKKLVRRIYKRGFLRKPGNKLDLQWGYAIFQKFIPDCAEWRMIRLGDSYFGHQKLKKGDFHSGSNRVGWYKPPDKLLDFTRRVCEKGKFTSMGLDIFEDAQGDYYVNELQTLFGSYNPSQMYIDNKPGRFLFDENTNNWRFEEGFFNQNYSHNLRLKYIVEHFHKQKPEEYD